MEKNKLKLYKVWNSKNEMAMECLNIKDVKNFRYSVDILMEYKGEKVKGNVKKYLAVECFSRYGEKIYVEIIIKLSEWMGVVSGLK